MHTESPRRYSILLPRQYDQNPWLGLVPLLTAVLLGVIVAWLPFQEAVVLIVGSLVILLTLIQPLFGLGLALLAGPLGALEQLLSGIVSLDSGQILLALALSSWIGWGLSRKQVRIPRTFLNVPILLFVFAGFISLLEAASIATGLKEIVKWLEITAVMMMVVDLGLPAEDETNGSSNPSLLGGPPKTIWIVAMLLLAGLSQALIGIWQFGLRGDGPEHFLILDRFYRAYGTFEQPNPFGGFMNLGALLAIGILVGLLIVWWTWLRNNSDTALNRRRTPPNWRFFWLTLIVTIITGIMVLALIFSWSRGAWLGFASGLAVLLLFLPRKRIHGLWLVGAIVGLVLLAHGMGALPAAVSDRLTSFSEDFAAGDVRGEDINDENYSIIERQAHWQAGFDMLRDNILWGVGFGNYGEAYADYALINWPDALGHAHNYYINLLAEVGVLGLVLYLVFWAAVLLQTIRLLGVLPWPDRGIALGLLAVWVALAAHHLVDKLYVNNIYIHLGVMLGLLQLIAWHPARANHNRRE